MPKEKVYMGDTWVIRLPILVLPQNGSMLENR